MISREAFKQEVIHWAEKVRVEPQQIQIRPMKRKWASCSSKGRLSFNEELLEKPEKQRAEVIVHELLHLRYPNHGKMFNLMLRKLVG
jgi:predicted metal-dependent hydrolase